MKCTVLVTGCTLLENFFDDKSIGKINPKFKFGNYSPPFLKHHQPHYSPISLSLSLATPESPPFDVVSLVTATSLTLITDHSCRLNVATSYTMLIQQCRHFLLHARSSSSRPLTIGLPLSSPRPTKSSTSNKIVNTTTSIVAASSSIFAAHHRCLPQLCHRHLVMVFFRHRHLSFVATFCTISLSLISFF
ncbi:hypothetical protein S245_048792 [Arachis hypogaea]